MASRCFETGGSVLLQTYGPLGKVVSAGEPGRVVV